MSTSAVNVNAAVSGVSVVPLKLVALTVSAAVLDKALAPICILLTLAVREMLLVKALVTSLVIVAEADRLDTLVKLLTNVLLALATVDIANADSRLAV